MKMQNDTGNTISLAFLLQGRQCGNDTHFESAQKQGDNWASKV